MLQRLPRNAHCCPPVNQPNPVSNRPSASPAPQVDVISREDALEFLQAEAGEQGNGQGPAAEGGGEAQDTDMEDAA